MSNLPTISDLVCILSEKPELRAQASRTGVINSALPDALRLKTEAIELRRQLVENKASLDHYAQTREQSKQQIAHAEKTLAALRQRKTAPTPKLMSTSAPPPSNTPHLDSFETLYGPQAAHFYTSDRRAILAESATRQHDRAQLEKEMTSVRATAKQQAQAQKYNR